MTITVDDTAIACGYVDPPATLHPTGQLGRDPVWHDLFAWFEVETSSAHDAMLVYIARRYGRTIPEVYAATDSWMKGKLGLRGYN